MAHKDGYIYVDTSVTPPKGVAFADIQTVLGETSDTLKGLCQSEKINQWAKYKPVGKAKLFTNDELDSNKDWKSSATWWKGDIKVEAIAVGTNFSAYPATPDPITNRGVAAWITLCGVKFLGFTLPIDVLRVFNPAGNHWDKESPAHATSLLAKNFSHVAPQGGASETFRQSDFIGYDHKASFAAFTDYDTSTGTAYINVNDENQRKYTFGLTDYAASNSLNFADTFTYLDSNAKFCVIIGKMAQSGSAIESLVSTVTGETTTMGTRQLTFDFGGQATNRSYLCVYCVSVIVNDATYYVPLMQSAGDTPNMWFPRSPNARAYKMVRLLNQAYNRIALKTKNQYIDSYVNLGSSSFWMNHLYMQLEINNDTHSALIVDQNSFKIVMEGWNAGVAFTEEITSENKRVVFKQNDVQAVNWGTSDAADTITPNERKACYLALYGILQGRSGQRITRILIYVRQNYASVWPQSPMAEFTGLNINIETGV